MSLQFEPIPESKWGVHETHCCVRHGCKYGYTQCPVELALVVQQYPCESCSYEMAEMEEMRVERSKLQGESW